MFLGIIKNRFKESWCYWYFVTTKKCNHISNSLRLIDGGREKAEFCINCGKCLNTLSDYERGRNEYYKKRGM